MNTTSRLIFEFDPFGGISFFRLYLKKDEKYNPEKIGYEYDQEIDENPVGTISIHLTPPGSWGENYTETYISQGVIGDEINVVSSMAQKINEVLKECRDKVQKIVEETW